MNTKQHDPRYVEILAEEIAKHNKYTASIQPFKVMSEANDIALTAMQRAVEEDTASLRTELERVRGAVAICESLANVRHLANPKDNPYTSSIIERAKQWRTEGGGDGK
jgi:hypothetical protein